MSDKTNDMIRELRRGVAMIHDALADPARPRQACGEVAAWWLRYAEACVSHVSCERASAAPITQIISEAPVQVCPICDIEGCRHIREAEGQPAQAAQRPDLVSAAKALASWCLRSLPRTDELDGRLHDLDAAITAASQPAPAPVAATPRHTGLRDNKGREICLGDRLRFLNKSPDTHEENWFPEYEVIWNPPSFILRHIGGGSNPDTPWLGFKYLSEQFETIHEAPAALPLTVRPGAPVTVTYTNYRGETALRRIIPRHIWWGFTYYHPEPQWLLTAFDLDKQAERDFALKDFGQPAKASEPHPYAGLLKELEAVMARYDEAMPPDDENGMAAPVMLGPEYFRQIITAIRAQIGGAA